MADYVVGSDDDSITNKDPQPYLSEPKKPRK